MKRIWTIDNLKFDLFLKVEMFYGLSGHKIFPLQIGKVGTPISKFNKTSGWIEELLSDAFDEMDFDPEKYKHCSTCYPGLIEAIQQHNSKEPLIIPFVLEFSNSRKTSVIGKVEHLVQQKGFSVNKK